MRRLVGVSEGGVVEEQTMRRETMLFLLQRPQPPEYRKLKVQSISLIPDSVTPEFAHTGQRISVPRRNSSQYVSYSRRYSDIPDFLYTGLEILVPTTPVRYKSN